MGWTIRNEMQWNADYDDCQDQNQGYSALRFTGRGEKFFALRLTRAKRMLPQLQLPLLPHILVQFRKIEHIGHQQSGYYARV